MEIEREVKKVRSPPTASLFSGSDGPGSALKRCAEPGAGGDRPTIYLRKHNDLVSFE